METGAIPEKYRKNVVTDLPRMVEVVGHYHPAPCWLTADMFPGVNVRVAGQEATNMVGKPHAAPHIHNVAEIYLAPSEKKGDLVVEVQMDDDKFRVEAPFFKTILLLVLVCLSSPSYGEIIYQWVDKNGTCNFTDAPERIPTAYRKEVQQKVIEDILETRPILPLALQIPVEKKVIKRDILGLGEESWRMIFVQICVDKIFFFT